MAVPDFQSVMRPILSAITDGSARPVADVLEDVCRFFDLTAAERQERLPSGKQTIIKNRVGWARTYLKKAGLLTVPTRGSIQITERGLQALKECPARVDVKYLKQFPEFVEFHTHTPDAKPGQVPSVADDGDTTPDEQLAQAYQSLMESLADEVLTNLLQAKPVFFEQVVVDLMLAMGYGGSQKEAGQATKATGDDGIDGIIKGDRLGLDTIYLQAKRWTNTVHRPEIDKFIGALTRQRARKGVFITTSDFSAGAREAGQGLDMKCVLIDGRELAQLMIEHNLGVTVKEVYEVKKIDSDYFSED